MMIEYIRVNNKSGIIVTVYSKAFDSINKKNPHLILQVLVLTLCSGLRLYQMVLKAALITLGGYLSSSQWSVVSDKAYPFHY